MFSLLTSLKYLVKRTVIKSQCHFPLTKLVVVSKQPNVSSSMARITNSMGAGTMQIPSELYFLNRTRLLEQIKMLNLKRSVILLQGGSEINIYDTELRYKFKQESFFMWLFGVNEPGCYGMIDVDTKLSYLFMPKVVGQHGWKEPPFSLDYYRQKYDVNCVHYTDALPNVLSGLNPLSVFTLNGRYNESGIQFHELAFTGKDRYSIDKVTLYPIMAELRVFKTCYEYEVMKYVIDVASAAIKRVMRVAKPGKSEYLCECEFLNYIYGAGGCRFASHNPICASGANTAYLNYGGALAPNDNFIQRGDLCLFDMGASYFGYCAAITCTFPVDGKFTTDQRMIYEAVLEVNRTVINQVKPGVSWTEMHLLGYRILLQNLKKIGIVRGEVADMLGAGVGGVFQPHGIGYLIGLDKYDVGGYGRDCPARDSKDPSLKHLRTARVVKEGMFLTVGPGCYFIGELLDQAMKDPTLSKFIVQDAVTHFRSFGGIRLEDDIYIHSLGAINLTKVPRTVEQVEDWLAGIDYDDKPSYLLQRRVSSVRFFT